jgi:hypothetical protein
MVTIDRRILDAFDCPVSLPQFHDQSSGWRGKTG